MVDGTATSETPATSPRPSSAYRLLALVLTALWSRGLQHVAEARVSEGVGVTLFLLVNPKLHRAVAAATESVVAALGAVGIEAEWRQHQERAVLVASPLRLAVLEASPSAEGLAAACQWALRLKMTAAGCPTAGRTRVDGVSGTSSAALYVTGGDEETNEKAATWAARWIARHFPEIAVSTGRHQVSGLQVERVAPRQHQRVLRVTFPGRAGLPRGIVGPTGADLAVVPEGR
jgi:hypothetical protein